MLRSLIAALGSLIIALIAGVSGDGGFEAFRLFAIRGFFGIWTF